MITKKRKILYISGTRADYGLMREALLVIKNSPLLDLEIAVTGMHLMPEFGKTVNEIKKDGFKIDEIDAVFEKDSKESMANFIGKFIQLLAFKTKKIRPDIILLLGDRPEMLAGAIVGAYLTIPVAHIHGGDITGTVDDVVRNAITKLSNIHFPATKKSAERIIKMGENKKRVFITGAPGLDAIINEKIISPKLIAKKYHIDLSKPILLVIQHSVSGEINHAPMQIHQTMLAIKALGLQSLVVYPNADAGGRSMIKVIEKYKKYPLIKIFKNISRLEYLSLLNVVSAMVGNSSSGIIETAPFCLSVINIGTRQEGREKTKNVIDVGYRKKEIIKAVKFALSPKFKRMVKGVKSPYGNGRAAQKIGQILSNIEINQNFLHKK